MKAELHEQISALEKLDPTRTKWSIVNGEVYLDKELLIAYAQWISTEFGRTVEDSINASKGGLLA